MLKIPPKIHAIMFDSYLWVPIQFYARSGSEEWGLFLINKDIFQGYVINIFLKYIIDLPVIV